MNFLVWQVDILNNRIVVNIFSQLLYIYFAAIVTKRDGRLQCGATIIDQYYALTAAHCVNTPGMYAEEIELLVGEHDYRTRMLGLNIFHFASINFVFYLASETPYSKKYEIASVSRHPNYSSEKDINDIAIVMTRRPISFNTAVGPACLPFKY